MKRTTGIILAALAVAFCVATSCDKKETGIKIIAHRGYWTAPEAKNAQNSIKTLQLAQEYEIWGSEFDVRMTKDYFLVVNHDGDINGKSILDNNYEDIKDELLSNGEKLATLSQYLEQGKKSKTVMELEIKGAGSPERDSIATMLTIKALKDHNVFDPKRVEFQAFSFQICKLLAKYAPGFSCLYLEGDLSPEEIQKAGLNGIAYSKHVFMSHPDWVQDAKARGIKTDVWTINEPDDMRYFIEAGLDQIESDYPLVLREVLGELEEKAK